MKLIEKAGFVECFKKVAVKSDPILGIIQRSKIYTFESYNYKLPRKHSKVAYAR